jgi:hypothetical protein
LAESPSRSDRAKAEEAVELARWVERDGGSARVIEALWDIAAELDKHTAVRKARASGRSTEMGMRGGSLLDDWLRANARSNRWLADQLPSPRGGKLDPSAVSRMRLPEDDPFAIPIREDRAKLIAKITGLPWDELVSGAAPAARSA